jgi:two-component system nitrogen regulation response regulator NtrX
VVAATNKNLPEEIQRGTFREDLYHRINVIPLQVPPLRERREDIPLLAGHFLQELGRENDAPPKTFTSRALEALTDLPWPGNVRELKNFIWRLAILTPGPRIDLPDLNLTPPPEECRDLDQLLQMPDFREARARFEKEYLRRQLEECGGSVSLLAEKIGLERSHLYRKLKAFGLEPGKEGEG